MDIEQKRRKQLHPTTKEEKQQINGGSLCK
jgi:hypothetical protein